MRCFTIFFDFVTFDGIVVIMVVIVVVIIVVVAVGGSGGEQGPIGGRGDTAVVLFGNFTIDATPLIRGEIRKRINCIAFNTNVFSIKNVVDIIPDVVSGGRSIIGISAARLSDQEIREMGIFCD